jgi:hypothetical protein
VGLPVIRCEDSEGGGNGCQAQFLTKRRGLRPTARCGKDADIAYVTLSFMPDDTIIWHAYARAATNM